jgi:hypothetical protein
MTIDEQIAVLQAYKAGKRIDWHTPGHKISGQFDIGCFGCGDTQRFDFLNNIYKIAPSFIIVNGVEVPEPVRVMPEFGADVFIVDGTVEKGVLCVGRHTESRYQNVAFANGLMHLTEAAARQHYEALILPSKQK